MTRTHDVSVCGTYILDILGVPVTEIPPGGSRLFLDEIRLCVAGTGGGSIVAAARLGLKAMAFGAVGGDEKADWVLDAMARDGIDVSCMERIADAPTSATILPIRPDGSRPALHAKGASRRWRITPQSQARACGARVLHLAGVGSMDRMDGAPSLELLKSAKAAGCITTIDLIMAQPQVLDLLLPLMPHLDFFLPSIDETSALVGSADPAVCARFFIDRGAGACAITLGAEGSFVMTRDGRQFSVPAYDVAVKDTSGCGDAYSGAFITGLVRGWDLAESARFASAAAALVATGLGSAAHLKSFDDTVHAMNTLPVKTRAV